SQRALVFAAYRRRFTNEQTAEWETAELVVPAFAGVLGAPQPNTTAIVPSPEGLTAVYWDDQPVPARVVFHALPPEADEDTVAQARARLLAAAPRNEALVLTAAPSVESAGSEREMAFRADGFESRLPLARTGAMDVRDKEALATLRRSQRRDVALWRGFLALVGLLLLLGLAELALIGAGVWQQTRVARANQQRPVVEKLMTAQSLTTRINELSTKRLLPFEMIMFVMEKRPADVTFLRAATTGLYGLNVDAYTASPAAASAFQSALSGEAALERVEIRDQRTRDNVMTFTLAVTFRPDAIKPATTTP
ncbi:MAG TPA: hypothetical protein VEQ65_10520, partial [Opitutus sp.]|nr:hypothetical protein [Opitutus sp.]